MTTPKQDDMKQEAVNERRCKGCGGPLELCPPCSGKDKDPAAGSGQRGYYICQDTECSKYEFCCGC